MQWRLEEDVWYGWPEGVRVGHDDVEPLFEVRQPEPGVWAGWLADGTGSSQCVTRDYAVASAAKREIDENF